MAVVPRSVRSVRLLIPDTATPQLLDDTQLADLLVLNGAEPTGTVEARFLRLAAADALEIIASSEALVSKAIRTQDLQTNGPAVAAELRARAAALRVQVVQDADAGQFDVVEATGYGYGCGDHW